jgi:hypothetical protein
MHPKDSCSGCYSFEKGKTSFEYTQSDGFSMVTEVKTRLKFTKEGYDWANKSVRYYSGSGIKERIFFSDAVT